MLGTSTTIAEYDLVAGTATMCWTGGSTNYITCGISNIATAGPPPPPPPPDPVEELRRSPDFYSIAGELYAAVSAQLAPGIDVSPLSIIGMPAALARRMETVLVAAYEHAARAGQHDPCPAWTLPQAVEPWYPLRLSPSDASIDGAEYDKRVLNHALSTIAADYTAHLQGYTATNVTHSIRRLDAPPGGASATPASATFARRALAAFWRQVSGVSIVDCTPPAHGKPSRAAMAATLFSRANSFNTSTILGKIQYGCYLRAIQAAHPELDVMELLAEGAAAR